MSVVISFEETGPCRKRLTIEVPAPAVDAETGRVIRQLGRGLRLPGFRKGKVPAHIIRQRFPEEIQQRVAEVLVPRYMKQAEAEKNLDPLTQPQIEDFNLVEGEPMTFVALVDTRPEIELGDLESFDLPEAETEPSDEEVDDAILDIRRERAPWQEVERAAGNGDLVEGQIFDLDGENPEEGQAMRLVVGDEKADEQLSLTLTGLSAGQSATFERAGEEGEPTKSYRAEVETVREQQLPDLDDDFAKQVGAPDVDGLRDQVVMHLQRIKTSNARQQREKALLDQLRERHPLEVPDGVVDQEVERMMREYAGTFQQQGMDLRGIDWERVQEGLRPEASQRVHGRLILDAIAKEKDLRLDESEFEATLAAFAAQQQKTSLQVRQELAEMGRLPDLRADQLRRQAMRMLLGDEEPESSENDESDATTTDATATDATSIEEE